MGHLAGKDIYYKLGKKIDNLSIRTPMNKSFYLLLKELYTVEEADLIIKMPYKFSSLSKLQKITKIDNLKLKKILDKLCNKGLVLDFLINDEYQYNINPLIPGIFEFPLMRFNDNLDQKKISEYLEDYFNYEPFWKLNFNNDNKISVLRTLPYTNAIDESNFIEILDYEKIDQIVENSNKFSTSICACRHKKMHLNDKKCNTPIDNCSTFGNAADYFIRNKIAKEISKSEMKENIARSKELGLVFNADNVKNDVSFICHCCKCCCVPLNKIRTKGYENLIITSTFIAEINNNNCTGCKKCISACPIDAILITNADNKEIIKVNKQLCLGCGVCHLKCNKNAIKLVKRKQEIIHPSTTIERVVLQSLERGTFQNLIFDNPESISQNFLRFFIGAIFKLPPVKRKLLNKILKSNFLEKISNK